MTSSSLAAEVPGLPGDRKKAAPRDAHYLGLQTPVHGGDPYRTLEAKKWRADARWMESSLLAAKESFLAALPTATPLPRVPAIHPVEWTVGHVAFTYDMIVADPLGQPKPGTLSAGAATFTRDDAWALYDSSRVSASERYDLLLSGGLPDARPYLEWVHDEAAAVVKARVDPATGLLPPDLSYLLLYFTIHTLWHTEDLIHTRNTHRLPPPPPVAVPLPATATFPTEPEGAGRGDGGAGDGDVLIPGGTFYLGAREDAAADTPMVFDCEKWEHPVDIAHFHIARHPVTNEEFAAFVEAGGYENEAHWSFEGARWLRATGLRHPRLWRRAESGEAAGGGGGSGGAGGGGWLLQWFDQEQELPPRQPVSHVSWYEADAFCRWAGRRLPTEAEWEAACCGVAAPGGGLAPRKARAHAWGDEPADGAHANIGMAYGGALLDVDALPEGDSSWGCRQMEGNVWEWTASTFYPWPGYVMDYPYREQSAPHFGTQKVARGGCFATPAQVVRGEYRSFYHPCERHELAVGFRTASLHDY